MLGLALEGGIRYDNAKKFDLIKREGGKSGSSPVLVARNIKWNDSEGGIPIIGRGSSQAVVKDHGLIDVLMG